MNNVKSFIMENAVDEGYLNDWYQASIADDPRCGQMNI